MRGREGLEVDKGQLFGRPLAVHLKAGFRRSFDNHDCSGTVFQVTQQGRRQ